MDTPAIIAIEEAEGFGPKYSYIGLQFDGYFSGAGSILFVHYDDDVKVKALIDLGELFHLGASPYDPPSGHTERDPVDGYCVAYKRDAGEEWNEVAPTIVWDESDLREIGVPYKYLYRNGQWYGMSSRFADFTPLEDILASVSDTDRLGD